jgi:DNA-binding NtrC family response regulator
MSEDKGRVLIVDDEESIRRLLRQALEMEGYSCITVCSGAEALEAVSQQNFDLVLLDMRMPGMSGLEVLSKLSEAHPDTCVIMVTALVDVDTSVTAMKMGAYDYLTKPLDLATLFESTERALEKRRLVLKTRNYRSKSRGSRYETSSASWSRPWRGSRWLSKIYRRCAR